MTTRDELIARGLIKPGPALPKAPTATPKWVQADPRAAQARKREAALAPTPAERAVRILEASRWAERQPHASEYAAWALWVAEELTRATGGKAK